MKLKDNIIIRNILYITKFLTKYYLAILIPLIILFIAEES
jgi:hypothetical protein